MVECLLRVHNLEDEMVSNETYLEDHSSIDEKSLQGWKNILDRCVEQGLIHRPYDLVDKLFS